MAGLVSLSEGKFNIAATVGLKSFVSLRGMGKWATVFNPSADVWLLATTGASGPAWADSRQYIDISGIHFGDGNWGPVTCDGIDLSWGHNIRIHNCNFIELKGVCIKYKESFRDEVVNCDFQDCGNETDEDGVIVIGGDGNDTKRSDDIKILDCDFLLNEYMSIEFSYNQSHIWIARNYFENDSGVGAAESIYHIGSADSGATQDSSMWRSWITDNLFFYVELAHIKAGEFTAENSITGNKFLYGAQAYLSNVFGDNLAHRRLDISNNLFFGQTGRALELALPYYNIITNNVFDDNGEGQYNFYPSSGIGWVFTGNVIEDGLGINNDGNTGEIIRDNFGIPGSVYVGSGEQRVASGSLTAAAQNDMAFTWQNPHLDQGLLIDKIIIDVTTGSTGAANLDVALDGDGTGTGTDFFDNADLQNVGTYDSKIAGDGGQQVAGALKMANYNGADDWITGKVLDAAGTGLVGKWYIYYTVL